MAYSSDIAGILTDQFAKFATLNRHQLAGHVANLDFWADEVRHCLDIIDGYYRRFDRMKAAQVEFTSEHGTVVFRLDDPCHTRTTAPPPRRVADAELEGARRSLCDAAYRFLIRCFQAGLIGEETLRRTCDRLQLGVETSDLRRGT